MADPAPWASDPVATAPQTASQAAPQPATASPDAPWLSDAPAATESAPAAFTGSQELPGFTDEQKQQILDYIPKATDAADLERFSSELTQGHSHLGNAEDVLKAYQKGHRTFSWEAPTAGEQINVSPTAGEQARDAIGEGLLNGIDAVIPGLGTYLKQNTDAGKAFTEHFANSLAADYGPEAGGLIDSIINGGSVANNTAHERAILEGDSEGHGVASTLGELGGVGASGAMGNEAGLANLPRLGRAAVAAGEGAAYGSGAAGPDHRIAGAATGAALGAGTDAAIPLIAKLGAGKAVEGAASPAVEASQAANDLGVDLPRFVVGGPADAKRASALEQTAFGSKPISAATQKMLDQAEGARSSIAGDLGTASDAASLGDQVSEAAAAQVKQNRQRIGMLYDQARTAAAGTPITAIKTGSVLQRLIAQEKEVPGGTAILPILERYEQGIEANGGILTIDGARGLRTDLRDRLTTEAGATPDNADRLTNLVMGAVNGDIQNSLEEAGKDNAFALYKQADAQWAQQRSLEDDVLKPFLGRNFDNWGEDVAKKINSDARGNGTRLARFLSALPEDQANNVRASLIMHMGNAKEGAQNAAGDAFSLDTFLTNWNQLKGSRNLIFPKGTVQALDKLASVAQVAKGFSRTRNFSNTGGVVSAALHSVPTTLGLVESVVTHDPKGAAIGLIFSALSAAKQYGAAKLLASPTFAKKLAATPLNPKAATSFWSRPWVNTLATENPAIASEIRAFQAAFLSHANDNAAGVSAVSAEPNGEDQQQ
jgi:hypothetical protein